VPSWTPLVSSLAPSAIDAQALELRAPWGLHGEYRDGGGLYIAAEGGFHVHTRSGQVRLEAGDAFFMPVGERHALRDQPSSPTTSVETFCRTAIRGPGVLRAPGRGPVTRLLTFGFLFEVRRPWVDTLAPVMIPGAGDKALVRWLVASADLLRTPLPLPAKIEVARAVMRVLYALARPSLPPDDRLVRAYARLRDQPGRPWTVAALASVAGMSRSAFAAAFTASLGEPPIRHLRRLRLDQARTLRGSGLLQKQLADTLGYAHGRSLTRALRRGD
jgi:AraC-like DNA-binding protein